VVQAALEFIENQLDEEIRLEEVAKSAHVSLAHLYRLFPLYTGMTIKEYARLRRMTRAAVKLRNSEIPIIEVALSCGYESQDSFSKAFARHFGFTPGEYRHSGRPLEFLARVDLMRNFIHKAAHESVGEGHVITNLPIYIFTVFKPAHKWVAWVNREEQVDFYEQCERIGKMAAVDVLEGVRNGGGWLAITPGKWRCSYGKEVAADFDEEIPQGCEVFEYPASTFLVFNHPPYPPESHGSVVTSVWMTMREFDVSKHGYVWAEEMPLYEDDDEHGFTVSRAVRLI